MPEDKPKSNMEIATDALKAEIAEEVVKPTPNWPKVSKLTTFLRSQREIPSLAEAVREEIAAAGMAPGVGAYVTSEDADSEPNNFAPYMRRVRTPSVSAFPPEVQTLIDRVIEISPFQADKAKKMLECVELLENRASCLDKDEHKDQMDKIYAFTDNLVNKAMDILRPELGPIAEEIKPAIRKLDLEDEDEDEGVIDAEFGAK